MTKRKLFNEWYGYDKKVPTPPKNETTKSAGVIQQSSWWWKTISTSVVEYITEDSAKAILSRFSKNSKEIVPAATRWYPPADGRTEEDFINWVNTVTFSKNELEKPDYSQLPWYASFHGLTNWGLKRKVYGFFNFDEPRSDMLFRLIELSEFMDRATDTQTFEQFLLTDEICAEKCRKLDLTNLGKYKDLISSDAPRFFSFGRGVGQNTRNLFLPLTKAEMDKVLDYANNPMLNANWIKSYSYEWAELFVKTALGQHKMLEIKMYDITEIREYLMYRIIEKYEQDAARNKSKAIELLMHICHALGYLHINEDGCRGLSYLIGTDVFTKLNTREIVAIACAYEDSRLWAESERGKSAIEIATELMDEEIINPNAFCELIAHIILNAKTPISVTRDFEWEIIKDVPSEWAHSLIPQPKNPKTPQTPSIIDRILKT